VRQLDVSERVLNLMCAELEDGSELRKGLTKMANITSISDVLENSDLHAVIQEHLRALNKN
jgi:alanine racemase